MIKAGCKKEIKKEFFILFIIDFTVADRDLRSILRNVDRRQYVSPGQLESYTRDYSKRGAGKKPCTVV